MAPHRLCSLDLDNPPPKDFPKLVAEEVATPEQSTAFRVVLVSQVAYYLSAEHRLGLGGSEARKHVPGVVNATGPYQRVFPNFCMRRFSMLASRVHLLGQPLLAQTNPRQLSSRQSATLP